MRVEIWSLGVRVWGLGFRGQGLGFGVWGLGFGVVTDCYGLLRVARACPIERASAFRVSGFAGFGIRDSGFEFRVSGLGF